MGDKIISEIVTIAVAIVGLATIAVIVGKGSQTAGVITAGANGFASDLKAAVSPVSGGI